MARREFSKSVKVAAFHRSGGYCEDCGAKLFPGSVEYDHSQEDFFGGEPTLHNCRCICKTCHRSKTTASAPVMAKTRRQEAKNAGIRKPSSMPGSRASKWKRTMDGRTVLR